jgi:metallo-beta-lactamase class B
MTYINKILFGWLLLYAVQSFGQANETDTNLKINQLTGDFYIYTTYNLYKGEKVPANGMYLVTNKGVVVFDTPWDTAQFQPLLDTIQARHHQSVLLCIATHFHDDRTAGLAYYAKQKIKTYTTVLTDQLSKKNNTKRADFLIVKDTSLL